MKRSISLLFVVFMTVSVYAQKEEVIASAGNYDETSELSLSWTLGEAFTPFSANENMMLTPSLQPTIFVTAIEETIFSFVDVSVYPNPASEFVRISFKDPVEQETNLFLFDSQGKLILRDVIEVASSEMVLDIRGFNSGVYLLRLVQGNKSNVYRVVKV